MAYRLYNIWETSKEMSWALTLTNSFKNDLILELRIDFQLSYPREMAVLRAI